MAHCVLIFCQGYLMAFITVYLGVWKWEFGKFTRPTYTKTAFQRMHGIELNKKNQRNDIYLEPL